MLLIILVTSIFLLLCHLLNSGTSIFCLNWTTENLINKLCAHFEADQLSGNLCNSLCTRGPDPSIEPRSCSSVGPHLGKELSFVARWQGRDDIFVKSKYGSIEQFDRYPYNISKQDFQSQFDVAIADIIFHNFNVRGGSPWSNLDENTLFGVWLLAQQKEYLLFKMYEASGLFPKVVGSCGHFYATEYMTPLSSLLHLDWGTRLAIAGQVLQLLERVQFSFPSVLRICDVKLDHLGALNVGGGRFGSVHILDGDDVYFESVLDGFQRHGNKCCSSNEDCSFFDCRMHCNRKSHRCDSRTANNNLQAVCENIFVKHSSLDRLFQPGFLHSAPSAVASRIDNLKTICKYDGRQSDFNKLLKRVKDILTTSSI